MTTPQTLLSLAGRRITPPALGTAPLILIDYQNDYLDGALALPEAAASLAQAVAVLAAQRRAGGLVIHVVHRGAPGGLFDRSARRGAIVDALTPRPGEAVVEKPRPNSFSDTNLGALLPAGGPLLIAGWMTHNCVSSTVRAALDRGHEITVIGDACATRDLPWGDGVIPAAEIHRVSLAALADRHAAVIDAAALLGEV